MAAVSARALKRQNDKLAREINVLKIHIAVTKAGDDPPPPEVQKAIDAVNECSNRSEFSEGDTLVCTSEGISYPPHHVLFVWKALDQLLKLSDQKMAGYENRIKAKGSHRDALCAYVHNDDDVYIFDEHSDGDRYGFEVHIHVEEKDIRTLVDYFYYKSN